MSIAKSKRLKVFFLFFIFSMNSFFFKLLIKTSFFFFLIVQKKKKKKEGATNNDSLLFWSKTFLNRFRLRNLFFTDLILLEKLFLSLGFTTPTPTPTPLVFSTFYKVENLRFFCIILHIDVCVERKKQSISTVSFFCSYDHHSYSKQIYKPQKIKSI